MSCRTTIRGFVELCRSALPFLSIGATIVPVLSSVHPGMVSCRLAFIREHGRSRQRTSSPCGELRGPTWSLLSARMPILLDLPTPPSALREELTLSALCANPRVRFAHPRLFSDARSRGLHEVRGISRGFARARPRLRSDALSLTATRGRRLASKGWRRFESGGFSNQVSSIVCRRVRMGGPSHERPCLAESLRCGDRRPGSNSSLRAEAEISHRNISPERNTARTFVDRSSWESFPYARDSRGDHRGGRASRWRSGRSPLLC